MYKLNVSPATAATRTRATVGIRDARWMRGDDRTILFVLLGLAILGVVAVLFVTRNGIGLSTDSVAYIDGARRLGRGEGFTAGYTGHVGPITHWPPLYSTVLAGLGILGIDPLSGARILASLLFGANVFVAGWLVRRHGAGGILPTAATSLLVLVSADLLEVHSWALSEALFLLLGALGIHYLAVYLQHPQSRRRLVAAAVLIALATLTRYLGITLIIAGGLAILWLASERWSRRMVDAVLFGAVSTAPLGLWIIRNYLVTGSTSSRELVVNPVGLSHLITAASTVSAWLVPPFVPQPIRIVLLLSALAVLAVAIVRGRTAIGEVREAPGGLLLRTLGCFIVVYGAFLTLSITLFDADVTFDSRILSPAHFLLLVSVGLVLAGMRRTPKGAYAALGLVIVLLGAQTAAWARAAGSGLGYSGEALRGTELWSAIEQLPEDTPLYSNAHDVVFIYTGRATRPLPGKFNPNSLVHDEAYLARFAVLREELVQNGGFVIHLPIGEWRRYMPAETELQQMLAPFNSRRYSYGTVYRVLPGRPVPPAER